MKGFSIPYTAAACILIGALTLRAMESDALVESADTEKEKIWREDKNLFQTARGRQYIDTDSCDGTPIQDGPQYDPYRVRCNHVYFHKPAPLKDYIVKEDDMQKKRNAIEGKEHELVASAAREAAVLTKRAAGAAEYSLKLIKQLKVDIKPERIQDMETLAQLTVEASRLAEKIMDDEIA